MMNPPTAGPTTMESWKRVVRHLTAPSNWWEGTSRGRRAVLAGVATLWKEASMKSRRYIHPMEPLRWLNSARASEVSVVPRSPAIITFLLSNTSAR